MRGTSSSASIPSQLSLDFDAEQAEFPEGADPSENGSYYPLPRLLPPYPSLRVCPILVSHVPSRPTSPELPRSVKTGCALSLRWLALEVYPHPPPREAPPSDPPRRVFIGPRLHCCLSVICTSINSSRFRQSPWLIALSIKTVATNRHLSNRPPPSSPIGRMDVGLPTHEVGKVKWGVSGLDCCHVRPPTHDTKMSQDAGFKLLMGW